MAGFFQQYFIDPIRYNAGYNIVNTSVYAIIFVLMVFGVYKLLKKLGVAVDKKFIFAVIPYIAMGGILRAVEDLWESAGTNFALQKTFFSPLILVDAYNVARNLLFTSPLIYIFVFFVALAALLLALLIERKSRIEYHKSWFAIGAALNLMLLSQVRIADVFALVSVLSISAAWFFVIWLAREKNIFGLRDKVLSQENSMLLGAHMFDATTTFVAIQFFPYFEQHVVAGFFISIFGPAGIYVLKLPVILLVLYYLDKEMPEKHDAEKRNFLKIAILALGLGPGLRNFLRTVMGV
ncbi:MAG: DUF63 family protein [Candidatus Aenigmarchaeota archaeon]|nr:DUF63 family protein [Candidatus Aenigmarchaeota archaeon]